ncbi:tRNA (cytidine(34)-2'-O)-methyltransferase [Neomicrococcus aestuarii]|uniref:Putative tRNA (cytidine(34)-2'-O)-methyltransferase n=1 Tax=Neomicrococcus aestuarii TaxID=556325 RepID=A0A1L2ZKH8_9MICC|nr:tRNA (cytidine(34)-2'-O)-methyltransferase [Neomicrococcus aestuarii]APF39697.1 tRNA (uridine(34)/cytosine(34)/5-carboxymethylaminomethyluridine(34)-2'-O)-methyltransferase TrmL [Neomicrococcus aestuarii]
MFRILFVNPEIPGNTGNAIRLAAVTGAELHLVEPVGFDFEDAKLRRAGLDYHDLAVMTVHANFEAALEALGEGRLFAYTSRGEVRYSDIEYRADDILMFGKESTGLDEEHLVHPRVTSRVNIPMLPGRRSLNLANSASLVVYEAWRQVGFSNAG